MMSGGRGNVPDKLHVYLQKCAADEGLALEAIPNSPLTTPRADSPEKPGALGSTRSGGLGRPKSFEEMVAHARSKIGLWISTTDDGESQGDEGKAESKNDKGMFRTLRDARGSGTMTSAAGSQLESSAASSDMLPGSVQHVPRTERSEKPVKPVQEEVSIEERLQRFVKKMDQFVKPAAGEPKAAEVKEEAVVPNEEPAEATEEAAAEEPKGSGSSC